jgi:uncharacterized membrane protein
MEAAAHRGGATRGDTLTVASFTSVGAQVSAVRTRRFVYAASATYAAAFVVGACLHYFAYRSGRLDLGDMVQAVWSTAHGDFLGATSSSGVHATRLASHVDPFLALFVPLWWVWPSPLVLLIVQAVAVSAGALPVYWLATKHLGSDRAAAHFALAYLLYPATQFSAFTVATGFHSVSLAVPLVLFAIWFLDEERLLPFAAFALLAALTKEEIPAAIGCLGIWYAVRKRHRLAGSLIAAFGVGASLVNFLVVIPHFAPAGANPFAGRYGEVGGSPTGILHKVVSDPVSFVHAVATGHKLAFLALLLIPFLGLWLLEPLLLLGAVPDLVINLLSSKPEQTMIGWHYTAGIVPFVVAAAILGASRLKRDLDRVSFWVLVGVMCTALYSPLFFMERDLKAALPSNPVRLAKAHALGFVPSGVPVSASSTLAGYVSARRTVYVFPRVGEAKWLILDANDPTYGNRRAYRKEIAAIDASARWKTVFASGAVRVLNRVTDEGR